MFSKKATKIEKNLHHRFDAYLVKFKSTLKIWSIFVAFLENMNFKFKSAWWVGNHEMWDSTHIFATNIPKFPEFPKPWGIEKKSSSFSSFFEEENLMRNWEL